MVKRSWTQDETNALCEAVKKYGKQWTKIKEIYGPKGNGKLSDRITGSRLAAKAVSIAKELYSNPDTPIEQKEIFHCIIDPSILPGPETQETKVSEPKTETKPQMWTKEQDKALLKGYSKHANKYRLIVKDFPVLATQNTGMRLRDRLVSLQKIQVKNGKHVIPPPGKEQEINALLYKKNKLFIECPSCQRIIFEKELIVKGLECTCGITARNLSKALGKYPRCVYIISKKGYTLTDPVEYVGIATNLYTRLYSQKWMINANDWVIRISLRLSEKRTISMLSPVRNIFPTNKESDLFTISGKQMAWHEQDLLDILNKYNEEPPPSISYIFDNVSINSAGPIDGTLYNIDTAYCYRKDKITCECKIPCNLRALTNKFRGLPVYHPLEYNEIKRSCITKQPNINYSLGLPCDNSKRFLVECSQRNQSIQESTKKAYEKDASTLYNLNLFKTPLDTLFPKLIKMYASSTIDKLLSCANVLIMNMTNEERLKVIGSNWIQVRNEFLKKTKSIRAHITAKRQLQEKSKREQELWVPYDTLMVQINEYFKKVPEVGTKEYEKYLLVKLHTVQASIRNDYRTVKLFEYNTKTDNYIDWENKKFIFNDIKNSKFIGRIETPIEDKILNDILNVRNLRKSQNSNLLVYSKNNEFIPSNTYTGRLNNIMQSITGKCIGSQMLRKITITHYRKDELTTKQNQTFSNKMHHSEHVSRTVYRRVGP